MQEKVARVGVQREKGFLYFIGQDCNVWRVGAKTGKFSDVPKHMFAKVNKAKETGYLYFLDKQGDVSRAKMMRGRSS